MKIALVVFLLGWTSLISARSLEEIRKSGVIRLAVDGHTPGFNYFEGKKLTGLEVELGEAIAKQMKLKVDWVVQPFSTLIIGIGQDRFDLIATSHAITDERKKNVDFLEPYYCSGATIFSKKGGPRTEAELAGKSVVVPVGTVYYDYLKKNPTLGALKTFPDEVKALQEMTSGRADVWVTEQLVGLAALKKHPGLQMGDVILEQRNAMVVAKGNTEVRSAVQQALQETYDDGTFSKLEQKYFGRSIRCKN
jgi:polar amino acid transport system substrate-binding protein